MGVQCSAWCAVALVEEAFTGGGVEFPVVRAGVAFVGVLVALVRFGFAVGEPLFLPGELLV